jgi:hypothetical protein
LNRSVFRPIALAILALGCGQAIAAPFDYIRIGDADGFGWTAPGGLTGAKGQAADSNGNGTLAQGEFLPDLDGNGRVGRGNRGGDNWDNRSTDEASNNTVAGGTLFGNGFTDDGSAGVDWTDVSLSDSAPDGWFPDGSANRPNSPTFRFDFNVATGDILAGLPVYLTLVFADYDVGRANLDLTFANSPARSDLPLTRQGAGQDGLIQATFIELAFDEVFTSVAGGYDGFVEVRFDADAERYLAFDYAELATIPIAFDPVADNAVPAPATLAIMLLGLAGLSYREIRARTKAAGLS